MKDLKQFIKTTIREFLNENQNSDNYLYHGTSIENAENIINNGFNEDTYWGDKSTAEGYAYSYNVPILIKISKSEIINLIEPNSTLLNFMKIILMKMKIIKILLIVGTIVHKQQKIV